MKKSKLIDLLKTFSEAELQKLLEFIHTPFFNKNEKVRKLGAHVISYAPDFDHIDLDKKEVYFFLFGDRPYKDLQINNIISDLLQLAYEYLGMVNYKQRPQLQKHLLLEELQKRDAPVHFDRNAKRLQTIIEQSELQNHDHFHQAYLLYEKLDQSVVRHAKRSFDENLQLQSDSLDLYYFCNKLFWDI